LLFGPIRWRWCNLPAWCVSTLSSAGRRVRTRWAVILITIPRLWLSISLSMLTACWSVGLCSGSIAGFHPSRVHCRGSACRLRSGLLRTCNFPCLSSIGCSRFCTCNLSSGLGGGAGTCWGIAMQYGLAACASGPNSIN